MKKEVNKIMAYIKKHEVLSLTILTFLFEFVLNTLITSNIFIIYLIVVFFILSIICLFFDKKDMKKNIVYIIYIIGVLIRTLYIIQTNIYTRQHDVDNIGEYGHLAYIYTIYATHKLPVIGIWQFYHPPFWHILASIWLRINTSLGINIEIALENIQILTLMFSSLSMIIINKICERLKLKDKYRYLAVLLFAFHPTMILFSGSINNDPLMTFLELLIIILLIDWYQETSIKNTILLAIVTGLCVMTKTNGALMAIPIIYVFIKKFLVIIKNNKIIIKDYFEKILLFGIISLPIGLWYQVRNYFRFGKINSIPIPNEMLYVGNETLFNRFFKINFTELFNFVNVDKDYNLPTNIIKSSIFGEYAFNSVGVVRIILIVLNIILIIMSLIFFIRYLIKDRNNIVINTLIIIFIVSIISMYIFNYIYPYTCSMDFRYIAISLVPGIIIIVYSLNEIKNKLIKIPIVIISCLFVLISMVFELII